MKKCCFFFSELLLMLNFKVSYCYFVSVITEGLACFDKLYYLTREALHFVPGDFTTHLNQSEWRNSRYFFFLSFVTNVGENLSKWHLGSVCLLGIPKCGYFNFFERVEWGDDCAGAAQTSLPP